MEERYPIWRVAADILNKQSRKPDKRWYSSEVPATPHLTTLPYYETFTVASGLD
jgi:hypothetical protein